MYINEYFFVVTTVRAVQSIDTLVSKNLNKADLKNAHLRAYQILFMW